MFTTIFIFILKWRAPEIIFLRSQVVQLGPIGVFLGPTLLAGVIVILKFFIKVAFSDRVGK